MEIKAIQTRYNGRLFRSRLEARWAVFFDCLDINYEYEPEGYVLQNGDWYLPDFLISSSFYLEIKGQAPTHSELEKLHLLAVGTKKRSYSSFWISRIQNSWYYSG